MSKDEVIKGIYEYLTHEIKNEALDIIIKNDIRVENFFAVQTGVFLYDLLLKKKIKEFNLQHTINLEDSKRTHIDIRFSDLHNEITFLELKHFSISKTRGQGRSLSFYTSNSTTGKKVGIFGDCEKFDNLVIGNKLNIDSNLVCLAFITPKPKPKEIEKMETKIKECDNLNGWKLIYPKQLNEQNDNFGIMTLQKSKSVK